MGLLLRLAVASAVNAATTPHEEAQHYHQHVYYNAPPPPSHTGSLTHEAIAGAAGFAAMHAYESHLRATGQPVSHPIMKEILAAAAAAEVEKLIETKGLTHLDRHRAKRMGQEQAYILAEQRYSGGTGFEYAQAQSGPAQAFIGYGGGSGMQYAAPQGPPPAQY